LLCMLMLVLGSKCSSQKEALCILYNPNKTKLLFVQSHQVRLIFYLYIMTNLLLLWEMVSKSPRHCTNNIYNNI
jgi:hypothetical protein